jgi:ElaB/YqjD/DUF883 family membrane-anchored ribosome-binding protein
MNKPATNGHPAPASVDRLMQDLQTVLEDADALLRATAGQAGEKVQQARARAEASVHAARERMVAAEEDLARRAQAAAEDADRYVRSNPWQAVGIAAGVAFLIGVLLRRR